MRRLAALMFGSCVLSIAGVSLADTILQAQESLGGFGINSQNSTTNGLAGGTYKITPTSGIAGAQKAPVACAPTATENSFQFLQKMYGITGLVGSNPYDAINELAMDMSTADATPNPNPPPPLIGGGTEDPNMLAGKEQYLSDHFKPQFAPGFGNVTAIQTVGQATDFSQAANGTDRGGVTMGAPTAAFIQQQLAAGEDVEITFFWCDKNGNKTGGGHVITADGINYNMTTNSGTLSFIDPFGGSTDNSAPYITSNSLMTVGGALVFGYTGGGAGNNADPDNTASTGFGLIDSVFAESPIPEPATMSLILLASGLIGLRRSRRPA